MAAQMLAGCVLSRCVVGWRLASVRLVFGCCRRGLGPRTRPAAAGPRPQPHCSWLAGASGARGCLCAGPTSTMAEGYNSTWHWMLHCPVMLVMAVLLTASVASAVGAIRLCASAASLSSHRPTCVANHRRGAGWFDTARSPSIGIARIPARLAPSKVD